MDVKALTLWQPWASLVVHGVKRYETRSWSTRHRGLLAIHSAKRAMSAGEFERFAALLVPLGYERAKDLPRGRVLGTVEVVSVQRTTEIRDRLDAPELLLGDYSSGRYAWELGDPHMLPVPVPVRGRQGLWTVQWQNDWLNGRD
jgi:hypothetical protein